MAARGIHRRIEFEITDAIRQRMAERTSVVAGHCWEWLGSLRNDYGILVIGGKIVHAHRIAYTMAFGRIPDGMIVAHKCDNKLCVNPDHLEAITPAQNNRDAIARMAPFRCHGEQMYNAKLTRVAVAQIWDRRKSGETIASIARALSVHPSTVRGVLTLKNWRRFAPTWAIIKEPANV